MLCGSASLSQSMETPPPPRPPSMPSPAPNATRRVARRGGAPAVAERRRARPAQLLGLRRRRLELLAHLNWIVAVRRRIATEEEVLQREAAARVRGKTACPCPPHGEATLARTARGAWTASRPVPERRQVRAAPQASGAPRSRRTMPLTRGCSRGCEIQSRAHPRRASRCRWRPATRCRRRRSTRRSAVRWCTMRRSVPFTRWRRSSSCEASLLRLMTLCEYHERRHEAAIAADRGKVKLFADSDSDDDGAAAEAEGARRHRGGARWDGGGGGGGGAKVDRAALLTALLDREIEFARARRLVSALLLRRHRPLLDAATARRPPRGSSTHAPSARSRRRRRCRRRSTPPPPPPSPRATSVKRSPPSPRAD